MGVRHAGKEAAKIPARRTEGGPPSQQFFLMEPRKADKPQNERSMRSPFSALSQEVGSKAVQLPLDVIVHANPAGHAPAHDVAGYAMRAVTNDIVSKTP